MSDRRVTYPKSMRDRAKANGKSLCTIDVNSPRLGGAEFQFYSDDLTAKFLANFAAVLAVDRCIDKAIEAGRFAVNEQIEKDKEVDNTQPQ